MDILKLRRRMEPHGGLNYLDDIVLATVVFSGLLAMMRGFFRELFSLLAWTGAYFAAEKLHPLLVPWMHHYIKSDNPCKWASVALIFVVALILLMAVGSVLASYIKGPALTYVDRSLGFIYGLLRGVVVVSLLYLAAIMILWPDLAKPDAPPHIVAADQPPDKDADANAPPDLLLQARTRPVIAWGAEWLKSFIPQDMIDKTLKGVDSQRAAAAKAARDSELERLSTPAPPSPTGGDATTDSSRLQGAKP